MMKAKLNPMYTNSLSRDTTWKPNGTPPYIGSLSEGEVLQVCKSSELWSLGFVAFMGVFLLIVPAIFGKGK